MGDVPVAATLKVAVCPAFKVWLDGCVVIAGATAAGLTVRTAGLLAELPAEFVTTAVNCARLSVAVSAGVM
jgi:hypothetical protein